MSDPRHLAIQVDDDPDLLRRMLDFTANADALYRPTNYWSVYEAMFLPELKRRGLTDFRRRQNSILASFSAVDTDIRPVVTVRLPRGGGLAGRALTRLVEVLPVVDLGVTGINPVGVVQYAYWKVRQKFDCLGLDIAKAQTNRIGNPSGVHEIEGTLWSSVQLSNASLLADALAHIDLPENPVICELGPGLGRNVEMLAELYSEATLLMFDIPPQLYVSNQYMKKRFPDRVVPYEKSVDMDVSGRSTLPDAAKGKIVVLPAARMPMWASITVDLFWNSASFQEMEPDVVENYLGLAQQMRPQAIYINASPRGNYWGEWKPGRGGTKQPVTENLYKSLLAEHYVLDAEYMSDIFNKPGYRSYVFKLKPQLGLGHS